MKAIVLTTTAAFFGLCKGSAIDVQVDEKKTEIHVADSVNLFTYICLLTLTILTLWAFKTKKVRIFHESGLAVMYGLGVGLILKLTGSSNRSVTMLMVKPLNSTVPGENYYMPPASSASRGQALPDSLLIGIRMPTHRGGLGAPGDFGVSHKEKEEWERPPQQLFTYVFREQYNGEDIDNTLEQRATFNPEIFFYVLLPPIIFHAGYSMRRKAFFDNLGAILAFAFLGTFISTIAIAIIVYGFAQFISASVSFRFLDMLYFGAIISATDPVTVLTIFQVIYSQGHGVMYDIVCSMCLLL